MRILYLVDAMVTGGAARNTLDLMDEMQHLGHEVCLCSFHAGSSGEMAQRSRTGGFAWHQLKAKRIFDFAAWVCFIRLLKHEKFDCIHLEDPYPAPLAAIARLFFRVPVVVTRHVENDAGTTGRDRVRTRILRLATRLAADRAIVLADRLRQPFLDQYGIAPWRVVTVGNGIRTSKPMVVSKAELRNRLGWDAQSKIIIIVAVLRGGKGHDFLFDAFPDIRNRVPGAQIKVVGDGPERRTLEDLAAPLGTDVQFLGERSDVCDLLCASDVLALPSRSEAFPTVLNEAAMCGLPAVSSNVGGASEIVVHGKTGLIVPPVNARSLGDALVEILIDKDCWQRMSRAALEHALQNLTIGIQARRTLAVYLNAVGRIRRTVPQYNATVACLSKTDNCQK